MVNEENHTTNCLLALMTVILGSFTSVISAIVFIIITHHQYNDRMKRRDKITLTLSANIYLLIFLTTTILIPFNIQTLLGDLYGKDFNSSLCTYHGYFTVVLICTLYDRFVIQALYRLGRIVYSTYRWLRVFWFYAIAVPIQFTASCVLLCPLLFWHDIVYLPTSYYCWIPVKNIRGTLWITTVVYGFPVLCLSIIYIRITKFIHQQSNNQTIEVKRRQKREFLVFQRIIILVGTLFIPGVPGMILMISCYVTGYENPLSYSITWLMYETSMMILSVFIVLMTPQLKNIFMRRWQRNRVMPMPAILAESVQIRTIG